MRKLIIMLAVLLMPWGAFASNALELGVRLGADIMYVVTDSDHDIYPSNGGFGGALSFDVAYGLTKNLYVRSGVGVDYRMFMVTVEEDLSYCYPGTTDCGESSEADSDIEYYQALFVEIPLLLQWRIPDVVYFEGGLLADVKIFSKAKGNMNSVQDDSDNSYDYNKGYGFSVVAGVGHKFKSGLSLDFRTSFQFTDLVDADAIGVWESPNMIVVGPDGIGGPMPYECDPYGSYYKLLKFQVGVGYWF